MFNITENKNKRRFFDFGTLIPENIFPSISCRMMKLDIKETTTNYELAVELPGVKKENINVNISEDILTISVDKAEEITEENTKFIKKERRFGSYSRSFSLPDVEYDKITASYVDGILKLWLPKIAEVPTQTKIIDIE